LLTQRDYESREKELSRVAVRAYLY